MSTTQLIASLALAALLGAASGGVIAVFVGVRQLIEAHTKRVEFDLRREEIRFNIEIWHEPFPSRQQK